MSSTSTARPAHPPITPMAPAPRHAAESIDRCSEQPAETRSNESTRHAATAGGIRASHAEREATIASLHRALRDGRLDLAETEHRVTVAYSVVYRDELPPLLVDLPDEHRGTADARSSRTAGGPYSWSHLWVSLVWRARLAVWADHAAGPPTPTQLRTAALALGLALLWTMSCAIFAAIAVAS